MALERTRFGLRQVPDPQPAPLDQGDIDIALEQAQILEDDGFPTVANCIRACARAAQVMLGRQASQL